MVGDGVEIERNVLQRVNISNEAVNDDYQVEVNQYIRYHNDYLLESKKRIRRNLHHFHLAADKFRITEHETYVNRLVEEELEKIKNELDLREAREEERLKKLYQNIINQNVTLPPPVVVPPQFTTLQCACAPYKSTTAFCPLHDSNIFFFNPNNNNSQCAHNQKSRRFKLPCPLPGGIHPEGTHCAAEGPAPLVYQHMGPISGWIFKTETDLRPPPNYLPQTESNSSSARRVTIPTRSPPHPVTNALSPSSSKLPPIQGVSTPKNQKLANPRSATPSTTHSSHSIVDSPLYSPKKLAPELDDRKWCKRIKRRTRSLKAWVSQATDFLAEINKQKQATAQLSQTLDFLEQKHTKKNHASTSLPPIK